MTSGEGVEDMVGIEELAREKRKRKKRRGEKKEERSEMLWVMRGRKKGRGEKKLQKRQREKGDRETDRHKKKV